MRWRRSAVKGKGKGGFKGTCYKCGMRGHKADRCWQKGKGKGSKGDWEKGKGGSEGKGWSKGEWSNPGHTWDSSWYTPHWQGKTYGLEVDPWSAIEPVPYLCAVSLSSSCEEIFEPKRMTRETHTKRRSLKVRGIMHTSRSQCQQRKCGNELMHADAVLNELMNASQPLRQTFPVTKDSAHRSLIHISASGGGSKGVRHGSGSGWRRLSTIMDSGSAVCVTTKPCEECSIDGNCGVTPGTDVPHCKWRCHQEQM